MSRGGEDTSEITPEDENLLTGTLSFCLHLPRQHLEKERILRNLLLQGKKELGDGGELLDPRHLVDASIVLSPVKHDPEIRRQRILQKSALHSLCICSICSSNGSYHCRGARDGYGVGCLRLSRDFRRERDSALIIREIESPVACGWVAVVGVNLDETWHSSSSASAKALPARVDPGQRWANAGPQQAELRLRRYGATALTATRCSQLWPPRRILRRW